MIEDVIFEATPFNSQTGKLFGASQWQIHDDLSFDEPVFYDSSADSSLSLDNGSHLVPFTELPVENGTYFWRVRYQTSEGVWGEWSAPTEFEITGIEQFS